MLYYVGRFPPPYGGVTVKNDLLFNELNHRMNIKKIDTNQLKIKNIKQCYDFGKILLNNKNRFIIGLSKKWRLIITAFLYYLNPTALRDSLLIVMGGQFAQEVTESHYKQKWFSCYRRLYVETEGMIKKLKSVGFENVDLLPNCRPMPKEIVKINRNSERLQCVFFSMIYPEKGVDIILDAAKNLNSVDFNFWGELNEDYKERFLNSIEKLENCKYHGVFRSNGEGTYRLLNQYDVLLFPTLLKSEGVPGVLVEAKIAALPAIVNDIAYNAELVTNDVDGVVINKINSSLLAKEISCLDHDRIKLNRYKIMALESSKKFIIDYYIDSIIEELNKNCECNKIL